MRTRQATSLRVDQELYLRLARLADAKGTSITRQLEDAIRRHLEAAVVEDDMPVVQPAIRRVVEESIQATISGKVEEMKERLASLLARQAIDTACLYLIQTRQFKEEQLVRLRGAAARHVRGKVAEFQAGGAAREELAALRAQVQSLQDEAAKHEQAAQEAGELAEQHQKAAEERKKEVERINDAYYAARRVVQWQKGLLHALQVEWDKPGLLNRRKPYAAFVGEYQRLAPRPEEA